MEQFVVDSVAAKSGKRTRQQHTDRSHCCINKDKLSAIVLRYLQLTSGLADGGKKVSFGKRNEINVVALLFWTQCPVRRTSGHDRWKHCPAKAILSLVGCLLF